MENSNNNKCHLVNMKRLYVDYRMYRNIRFQKKKKSRYTRNDVLKLLALA